MSEKQVGKWYTTPTDGVLGYVAHDERTSPKEVQGNTPHPLYARFTNGTGHWVDVTGRWASGRQVLLEETSPPPPPPPVIEVGGEYRTRGGNLTGLVIADSRTFPEAYRFIPACPLFVQYSDGNFETVQSTGGVRSDGVPNTYDLVERIT